MKIAQYLALLWLPLMVTACGGGGGSSGGSGGGEKYTISTDSAAVNIVAQRVDDNPAFIAAKDVIISYKGDGVVVGYPPGASVPSFISATLTDLGGGKMKLTLQPLISLNNWPNMYRTTYRLVTGKADGSETVYKDIVVTLELTDNLDIIAKDTLAVGVTPDHKFQSSPKITIKATASSWKLSSDASWVHFSPSEGVGLNYDVKISVDADKLGQGDQSAKITVSNLSGSATTTRTLSILVDDARYWFEQAGVAFSSFSGENQLQKVVAISSNGPLTNITAEADVSWLTFTQQNNKLTLTAKREGLTPGMHYAQVILKQGNKTVSVQALAVGLYVSSDSLPGDLLPELKYGGTGLHLYADPIRPYLYTLTADLRKLLAYNIYTGNKILEIDTPEQADVRGAGYNSGMQSGIAADGSYIYIQDFLPSGITYHRFNLHSQSWMADISGNDGKNLAHLINGVPLGYTVDGQLINTLTGTPINKDDNCSIARDLWQGQVRNGSAYSYGKEVAYERGVSIANYVAGQAIVMQRAGGIICSDKHSMKNADLRYQVYSGFATTTNNGRAMMIFDELYNYDEQAGFSSVSLLLPQNYQFPSNSINIAASVSDGEGHNYVARSFFTGSAYQPDYVTQYDNSGKVINTVKQVEGEGGEVANMLVSGDGRRLLIEHKAFDMSPGRFRSTNIQ